MLSPKQTCFNKYWAYNAIVGHDWPSKTINFDMLAAGMGPQPIEANDIVTEFFDQFSLSD
jgi:hypothetical protein